MLILTIAGTTCTKQSKLAQESSVFQPIEWSHVQTEELSFTKYYSINPLEVTLQVPPYDLPLGTDHIANFEDFSSKIPLSAVEARLLEQNGFVVIKNPYNAREEYVTQPYKNLKNDDVPIFITPSSLLHLYHIQFDETLRQIEERAFYDTIWEMSRELLDDAVEKYEQAAGNLKEAAKRNVEYFAVGLNLLKPKEDQLCKDGQKCKDPGLASAYFREQDLKIYTFEVPDFAQQVVEKELNLIEQQGGFSQSPIFIYREDYSQYIPRGHYTRSEKLKNYFKAFIWYGRMSMLLKGSDNIPRATTNPFHPTALISDYDAEIQTIQASLIAARFAASPELKEKWERIYSITAFYVGLADDLGPFEYLKALNSVLGDTFYLKDLTDNNITKIKLELARYEPPKIYGGTGECGKLIDPGEEFTPEHLDECLEKTKGMRLMGQRFIPDSYLFSEIVSPNVGKFTGDNPPFTSCYIPDYGYVRCFPRGLDAMALLGSQRAVELLASLGDSHYEDYEKHLERLKEEFEGFSEADWNKNLYWAWLFALNPLLIKFDSGYPAFMQTSAWQDKELTAALASWAELRHDTILYAKQSYTMTLKVTSVPPPQKPVVGYVEPVPDFYNRLLALTKMTTKGLDEMNLLDDSARYRLENLQMILERLVDVSVKELQNRELTQSDYEFIKNFGDALNKVIADVDEKAKKTTIVADVHTDQNTQYVLEEGVGYVNLIAVAYNVPDGRILIGAGPVLTYYEFKQPIQERLTDEAWRELLRSNPPEKPEWISHFAE
ncbi:MAG: dTDP-glucose 4,6-dehydratase [candidate division Zixibacteria bacterium SM23_81]|nr:MAG: dTDP-glucose 4,6-dehydratase [candidate division Zixibacteria bacterium SM23_81]